MKKKTLLFMLIFFAFALFALFVMPHTRTYAQGTSPTCDEKTASTDRSSKCAVDIIGEKCDLPKTVFFGIPTWYEYLDGQKDAFGKCVPHVNLDSFKDSSSQGSGSFSQLLPIGLAIIDMLLRVAGLVAVAFIIYAGFQYVTSQGEPQATTQAKDGIINAMVGLAIVVTASALVAFIGSKLK